VLDTEHVIVVRTYIERWPRGSRAPEKVLVVVVEPDEEARNRCPKCGNRGIPVESDVRRWRTLDVHGKRCYLGVGGAADRVRGAREDHRIGSVGTS
jgi:hypothetical protein